VWSHLPRVHAHSLWCRQRLAHQGAVKPANSTCLWDRAVLFVGMCHLEGHYHRETQIWSQMTCCYSQIRYYLEVCYSQVSLYCSWSQQIVNTWKPSLVVVQ
jgi:hypothetical protein